MLTKPNNISDSKFYHKVPLKGNSEQTKTF